MNEALVNLKEQYAEAVKLHLWYSDSPFSFFKGKANKGLAAKHLKEAQFFYDEIVRHQTGGLPSTNG